MFEKEFAILGIEKTRDENEIRAAYRVKLQNTNPEDKPEEFKMLRAAYEEALKYARNGEEEQEQDERVIYTNGLTNNCVIDWMSRVIDVSETIEERNSVEKWTELLRDEACNAFDTYKEAGTALLRYLMDHYYMDSEIYRMLDDKFRIVENEDEWKEEFPSNFIKYVISKVKDVKNDTDFAIEWMKGEKGSDIDGFIRALENLGRQIWDKQYPEAHATVAEMEAMKLEHPFFEILKIRLEVMENGADRLSEERKEEILSILRKRLEEYPTSRRIPLECGDLFWMLGSEEESYKTYTELKKRDSHYLINKYLGMYEFKNGNFFEAEKLMDELLGVNEPEKDSIQKELDEVFLKQYGEEFPKDPVELQYYLKACMRCEKYEMIPKAQKECPNFTEMEEYGLLLAEYFLKKDDPENAISMLLPWNASLEKRQDESGKRLYAYSFLQLALRNYDLWEKNRDAVYANNALKAAKSAETYYEDDEEMKSSACYQQIRALLALEEYKTAIELADRMLEENPYFFQVICRKQECCVNLRMAQEVVDCYHRGADMMEGQTISELLEEDYVNLFINAVDVFVAYEQAEDAETVLERLKKSGIESAKAIEKEAEYLRRVVEQKGCDEDGKAVKFILSAIQTRKGKGFDDSICSRLYYQLAIVYRVSGEGQKAEEQVEKALELNPNNNSARYLKARFYQEDGQYEAAVNMYDLYLQACENQYNTLAVENIAYCFRGLGKFAHAEHAINRIERFDPDYEYLPQLKMDIFYGSFRDTQDKTKEEYFAKKMLEVSVPFIEERKDSGELSGEYPCKTAEVYKYLRDYESAIKYARYAVTFEPDNPYVHYSLGLLFRDLERFDEECEEMGKAIELAPPEKAAAYCQEALFAAIHAKNKERVKEYYLRSQKIQAKSPVFFEECFGFWIRNGEYVIAEQELIAHKKVLNAEDYNEKMLKLIHVSNEDRLTFKKSFFEYHLNAMKRDLNNYRSCFELARNYYLYEMHDTAAAREFFALGMERIGKNELFEDEVLCTREDLYVYLTLLRDMTIDGDKKTGVFGSLLGKQSGKKALHEFEKVNNKINAAFIAAKEEKEKNEGRMDMHDFTAMLIESVPNPAHMACYFARLENARRIRMDDQSRALVKDITAYARSFASCSKCARCKCDELREAEIFLGDSLGDYENVINEYREMLEEDPSNRFVEWRLMVLQKRVELAKREGNKA